MAWLAAHPTIPNPIEWPAYSPDVSPIENLWAAMQRDVNVAFPTTLDELKRAIAMSWRKRTGDQAYMKTLMGNGADRVRQLIDRKGCSLDY